MVLEQTGTKLLTRVLAMPDVSSVPETRKSVCWFRFIFLIHILAKNWIE